MIIIIIIFVLNMLVYKTICERQTNDWYTLGATWRVHSELSRHCPLLRQAYVRLSCLRLGIFSICWCWCFDCNMYAICCSSGIGKAIFVLKICLRQLHGLLKYFSKFCLRTFENQELSQVLSLTQNWAPVLVVIFLHILL